MTERANAPSRADAFRHAMTTLRLAGQQHPEPDVWALLHHETGLRPLDLVTDPHVALGLDDEIRLVEAITRRANGEPVGRITGQRDFWGLTFQLSPDTLEPRDDSETIIEEALSLLGPRRHTAITVLDLGTGTGCLLVALLTELGAAHGTGIDISPGAVAAASGNALLHGVGERCKMRVGAWAEGSCTRVDDQGAWADGLGERFDVIVSNPPYIPSADIPALEREVREHDPARALDGGLDGLAHYRTIIAGLPRLLKPDGIAVLEIGAGQERDVTAMAGAAGFARITTRLDLGGHVRAIGLSQLAQQGSQQPAQAS